MAEKKVIILDVETSGAVEGFENLNDVILQQKQITIEFKKELLLLEEQLKKTPANALGEQKNLKDRIDGLKTSIKDQGLAVQELNLKKQTASDTDKKFTTSTNSLTDSVVKNGGAMGVLNTITGGLAQRFKDAYEASDLLKGGMGRALTSFNKFSTGAKAALISTGIGALVVAVGVLASYWDDITGLVGGINGDMKEQGEIANKNVLAEEQKLKTLNSQDNILKLQGKTETEILNIKKQQTADVIKSLEIQLIAQQSQRDAQVEASKRNRDILSGVLQFISAPITILLNTIDEIGKAFGKDFGLSGVFDKVSTLIFDPEEVAIEGDKAIQETKDKLNELKNTQAGYEVSINTIAKTASDERKKLSDEASEVAKQDAIKKGEDDIRLAKERADSLEAIRKAEIDTESERRAEELLQIELQYAALIEQAILYNQSTDELKEAQRTKELELQAIFDSEDKTRSDKVIKEAQDEAQRLIEIEQVFQDAKRNALQSGLNLLMQFAGRNKAIALGILVVQKGLAVADIIVGASKSIAGQTAAIALANQAALATPAAIGSFGISAIPVIAANTASLLKGIASTKISAGAGIASILAAGINSATAITSSSGGLGGGGGGGGTRGGSAPMPSQTAPSFNIVGAQGLDNQIATGLGTQPTQPLRAYVVANEVTTQQSLDRNIIQNASLG
jgi:hypothetical protein